MVVRQERNGGHLVSLRLTVTDQEDEIILESLVDLYRLGGPGAEYVEPVIHIKATKLIDFTNSPNAENAQIARFGYAAAYAYLNAFSEKF